MPDHNIGVPLVHVTVSMQIITACVALKLEVFKDAIELHSHCDMSQTLHAL